MGTLEALVKRAYDICSTDAYLEKLGVVVCTCNPTTLEGEFRNSVGSAPVGDNSSSIGRRTVLPLVIQH